jgi:aryl sulfotransferase
MKPEVTRVYQNHHLDSKRWDVLKPRDGDIIITTSYKSGTTWTQQIMMWLLHGDQDPLPDMHATSPWLDARFMPGTLEEVEAAAEALPSPRFFKSHLPLDGLPYYPEARYIIVGRDPRDVFMSFFNHYSMYTDMAMEMFNTGNEGDPLPRCPEDPREVWRSWISRGWFEWESEGWPFWSNLHHTKTYWDYRDLPNFLFIHYNDMLVDLDTSVRKIVDFTGIDVTEDEILCTVEQTTFKNVKKKLEETPDEEDMSRMFFSGGQKGFFFKGSNGRWRDVLTDEDLALYEEAKKRVLAPECARWLEEGGPIP